MTENQIANLIGKLKPDPRCRAEFSLEGEGTVASEDIVYKNALLFVAGDYSKDKGLTVSDDDLKAMVDRFSDPVPMNIEHVKGEHAGAFEAVLKAVGDLGAIQTIWVDDDDPSRLRGEVRVPGWLDNTLKTKGVSVEVDLASKVLSGCAYTYTPYIEPAALMAQFAKRHDTWQGQCALQDVHDSVARMGAQCRKPKADMSSAHELSAIQKIHDLAVEHGARCSSMDSGMFANQPGQSGTKGENQMATLGQKIAALFGKLPDEDVKNLLEGVVADPAVTTPPVAQTPPVNAEFAQLVQTMQAQMSSMTAQMTAMTEQNAQFKAEAEAARNAKATSEATFAIDRLVANFQITPSEAKSYREMLGENLAAFNVVRPILEARAPLSDVVGVQVVDAKSMEPGSDAGIAYMAKVQEFMKAGMPAEAAFKAANLADPSLAKSVLAESDAIASNNAEKK